VPNQRDRAFERFFDAGGKAQTDVDRRIGLARKEAGTARVLENQHEKWRLAATHVLYKVCLGFVEFTADDFRRAAKEARIGDPTHVNAWSAVMNAGAKSGWMQHTGRSEISSRKKARGRRVPIWVSLKSR